VTTLQHDPQTKIKIKDALYHFLYDKVEADYQKKLHQIIEKNCILTGARHPSFVYKGEYYTMTEVAPPRVKTRLNHQLAADMDALVEERKRLNLEELPRVMGYLNAVLNATNNLPDILHLLPESIHSPIYRLLVTCPCNSRKLSDAQIAELKKKNEDALRLLKSRMVINLIS